MNNILREKISEGINFTYIPEEKFKTTKKIRPNFIIRNNKVKLMGTLCPQPSFFFIALSKF